MKIKEILDQKSGGIFSINLSKSMLDAAKEMYEKRIGALLVQSDTGEYVGILTDRDVLYFFAQQVGDAEKVNVSEMMTKNFFIEVLDSTAEHAESIMTENRVRHLPVVDEGSVIGIISIGDLVKAKLQETAVEAKSLFDYISA